MTRAATWTALLAYVALASAATTQTSGKRGAVACEVGECSEVGLDILKAGGTAADGMIAASLCVGTIAAYHSGIGGGGFGL
jgi:gamma-glutamyltranspeptidase/glutathione hydrolase